MKKSRRRSTRLDNLLQSVATPVFLVDAARKLLFFNAGCERLTGAPAAELVGQTCDYHTGHDEPARALTGILAPPPDVFAGREMKVPAYFRDSSGKQIARLVQFHPLSDDEGAVAYVLGLIVPIEKPQAGVTAPPSQQLHAELASLRQTLRQRFGIKSFIGRCPPMQRVMGQVQLARGSAVPVLVLGEAGTGKEHVARTIHYEGEARGRSFVPLDCRTLPALELKQTLNRILNAEPGESSSVAALSPGTLYLAEVEHLPRELQERIVQACAGGEGPAGLRIMASSSVVPFSAALEDDRLLDEFYYLFTSLVVDLPPLRDRGDDLLPLGQHFLEQRNRGSDKQIGGFATAVWDQFRAYNWPGNLDELRDVVDEAWTACQTSEILPQDLPFRFRTGVDAQAIGPTVKVQAQPLEALLERVEREQIVLALEQARFNKTRAAELLAIPRPRLYRRMEALGIEDHEEG